MAILENNKKGIRLHKAGIRRYGLPDRIAARWQLYLFLLLPLAYMIVFQYVPMLGIQIAFRKFNPIGGIWGSPWVGFKNFDKFFHSYQFSRILKNTLTVSFYQLLAGFPIPILLALALNAVRSACYRKVVQMVTYIPHFISVVVLVGMVLQVLNPRIGLYGILYQSLLGSDAPNTIGDPAAFPHIYVWSGIWQNAGWASIIYIAALSAVDKELHEAAKIDGANRLKRVFYIDLPCIIPTATILLILNAGQIMQVGFEKVILLQNPLNLSTSEVISTYVYKVALGGGSSSLSAVGDFSYATAIGFFNSVVNLCLIIFVNQVSKRLSNNSLW